MLETTNKLYTELFSAAQNLDYETWREKYFSKSLAQSWTDPKSWSNYSEAIFNAARTAKSVWKTDDEAVKHFLWFIEVKSFEFLRPEIQVPKIIK